MKFLTKNMELILVSIFIIALGLSIFSISRAKKPKNVEGRQEALEILDASQTNFSGSADDIKDAQINILPDGKALSQQQEIQDTKGLDVPLKGDATSTADKDKFTAHPGNILDPKMDYKAVMKTNKGNIVIDLFESDVPLTVSNFVFLSQKGFYNGTRSHRIMRDFMIQFGDPNTKNVNAPLTWGIGGPGYTFADEAFDGTYSRGTVAMANSGKDTNGSQFFIVHQTAGLPKHYIIFGRVSDENSLKVVDQIAETPVRINQSAENSFPVDEIVVNTIEISTTQKE